MGDFSEIKSKCDPKYKSSYKLPTMEDSKITASNPIDGDGVTTDILTREQLAKLP